MGTRWFAPVAGLNVAAGLLVTVGMLGGLHRPTSGIAPGVATFAPAVQGPPSWAQRVVDRNANGTYVVSWSQISSYVNQYAFDQNTGEPNHKLIPVAGDSVRASIFPVSNVWTISRNQLFSGHIVARIVSSGNYGRLGLIEGSENYLFVWQGGRVQHMAVLNALGRMELKLKYTPHGNVVPSQARDIVQGNKPNNTSLTYGALKCIADGRKACFVDSPAQQVGASRGSGVFQLASFQGGGGSQPWVSCVLLGCCCGGTNCHN